MSKPTLEAAPAPWSRRWCTGDLIWFSLLAFTIGIGAGATIMMTAYVLGRPETSLTPAPPLTDPKGPPPSGGPR